MAMREMCLGDLLTHDHIFEITSGGLYPEAWAFWTYACPYDRVQNLRAEMRAWATRLLAFPGHVDAPSRRPHEWVRSDLGHGEYMCRTCRGTNRELGVMRLLSECPDGRVTFDDLIERLHVEDGDGNMLFCEVLRVLLPGWGREACDLRNLWWFGGRIDAALALYRQMLPGWRAYEITFDGHWGRCMVYLEEDIEAARYHGYLDLDRGKLRPAARMANHPAFAILMALLRVLAHGIGTKYQVTSSITAEDALCLERLKHLAPLAEVKVLQRSPNDWYVDQSVEVADGRFLSSEYGSGRSPQEAVEAHWTLLTNLPPGKYLVVNAADPKLRREVRWNGSAWEDVGNPRDRRG